MKLKIKKYIENDCKTQKMRIVLNSNEVIKPVLFSVKQSELFNQWEEM